MKQIDRARRIRLLDSGYFFLQEVKLSVDGYSLSLHQPFTGRCLSQRDQGFLSLRLLFESLDTRMCRPFRQ